MKHFLGMMGPLPQALPRKDVANKWKHNDEEIEKIN